MSSIDPIIAAGVMSLIGSVTVTLIAQLFNNRSRKAEAQKKEYETALIKRQLEHGDIADVTWFIHLFYELLDNSYYSIGVLEKILDEHPEINGGTREKIEKTRACLKKIRADVREYFKDDPK